MSHSLFLAIHGLAERSAFLDGFGIFCAQWLPYILCAAFLVLVYYQRTTRARLYLFAEGALAIILARGIVTTTIHFLYNEPRPFLVYGFTPLIAESGSSFPSGHAAWFFALALVVWFTNRRWGWWLLGGATLMAIARVYVGVHWPLDVVAGAAIGLASAWFVHWLLKDYRPREMLVEK